MSATEEIIDYKKYAEEIEKWLVLKGEIKYMHFVALLKSKAVPVLWQTLKDTYRYDKRLLVNSFKYLSFFEEYLRALLWNSKERSYKKLEDESFKNIMQKVVDIKSNLTVKDFSLSNLEKK